MICFILPVKTAKKTQIMHEHLSNLFKEHTSVSQQLASLKAKSKDARINNAVQEHLRKDDLRQILVLYRDIPDTATKKMAEKYVTDQLEHFIEKNDILMIKTVAKGIPVDSQLHTRLKNRINEYLLDISKRIDSSFNFIKISHDMNLSLALNTLLAFFNTCYTDLAEMDGWIRECNSIIGMLHHRKYGQILSARSFKYRDKILTFLEIAVRSPRVTDEHIGACVQHSTKNEQDGTTGSRELRNLSVLKAIYKERELKYFAGCLCGALVSNRKGREELKYLINKIAKRSMRINVTIQKEMRHIIKEQALENEKEFVFLL
ncbi:hypothetical protein VCUG_00682 [Vavraia culicis subsp. floridensis]|uniref:Uncharacterized protein n=1 Tax=Vavraia culicis (isolate floridensis) TaxID=948595 RepID=L2GXK6_VAVCU|nr:uncharacterized protein VCUG_00682 [Vavraia culicis subsp. floridensis]ELA47840.1 hypothetical protein VCUG_00682 [Vavraia culicis subsp. floridensis]